MSISRRALYAAGEPLGDSATRIEAGRLVCGGGGGSSKSSSSAADQRLVTGEGSIGMSGNKSSLAIEFADYSRTTNIDDRDLTQNTTLTDSRSSSYSSQSTVNDNDYTYNYALDKDVAASAFDFAKASDALSGEQLNDVIRFAEKVFDGGRDVLQGARETVADAYSAATSSQIDAKGSIDQKTMIVIAVIGAAALYAMKKG